MRVSQKTDIKKQRAMPPFNTVGIGKVVSRAVWFLVLSVFSTLIFQTGNSYAGQASLSWTEPTTNTNGTALTDLAGYKVYYGTASGNYTQSVNVGTVTSYTLSSLAAGTYYFAAAAFDSSGNQSAYSNEVSKTIAAQAALTVSDSGTGSGTVTSSPSGISCGTTCSGAYNSGTTVTLSATAAANSTFAGWSGGGCSGTGTCSFSINANTTVTAAFTANTVATYTITATVGAGGSLTPLGSTTVSSGGSQTFSIAPSSGYSTTTVTVDGTSVGAVSSYTFSNVTANHTISATFTANPVTYTITATAGTGGSITPSGSTAVKSGGSQTYTITPSSGYSIASVAVNSASVGAVSSYTFGSVTANHTISATFTATTTTATTAATTSNSQPGVVFAADSGGGQYTSQSGVVYKADTDYSGGKKGSTTAAITGTSDPTLYQTERYGNFSYSIPLADGSYNVTLKFAEIYWTAAGKRIFNVSMQGTQVISDLDIYSKVGKNAAYDVTIPVTVTNGVLSISFTSVVDNAKVSAIAVTSATPITSFAADSGGGQYTSQSGVVYNADTYYSGGTKGSTTAAITGTSDPTLYQTERYGNFSYSIPLADGSYNVTLKFAEIYWTAAGERIFNVSMQGTQVISDLDIYSKVGKNAAYDVTIPVTVTNGMLNISFTSVVDNAKVSALLVAPQ